jgi:hypothetical protein
MRASTSAIAMIDLLAIAFLLAEYPSQLGKTRLVPLAKVLVPQSPAVYL